MLAGESGLERRERDRGECNAAAAATAAQHDGRQRQRAGRPRQLGRGRRLTSTALSPSPLPTSLSLSSLFSPFSRDHAVTVEPNLTCHRSRFSWSAFGAERPPPLLPRQPFPCPSPSRRPTRPCLCPCPCRSNSSPWLGPFQLLPSAFSNDPGLVGRAPLPGAEAPLPASPP